jgi:hypothetical protein
VFFIDYRRHFRAAQLQFSSGHAQV